MRKEENEMGKIFDTMMVGLEKWKEGRESEKGIEWRVKEGIKIVVNPEVGCPMCPEWIRTNRIWIVNEDSREIVRVYRLGTGRRIQSEIHPHVGSNGKICMGTADSVGEALWGKINTMSVFWEPKEWFIEMGHDCFEWEDDDMSRCDSCDDLYDNENIRYYEGPDQCLCDDCWHVVSVWCDCCEERVYTGGDRSLTEVRVNHGKTEYWCDVCFESARECWECEEIWDVRKISYVEGRGFCPDCEPEMGVCEECSEEKLKENLAETDEGAIVCRQCGPARPDELEEKGQVRLIDW
jgi:hypothetical protein